MDRPSRRALFASIFADVCGRAARSPAALRRDAAGRGALAGALGRLVARVREAAHLVTDADVEAARREGYDDDQLMEIVTAAALGESERRLRAVLRALGRDAVTPPLSRQVSGRAGAVGPS